MIVRPMRRSPTQRASAKAAARVSAHFNNRRSKKLTSKICLRALFLAVKFGRRRLVDERNRRFQSRAGARERPAPMPRKCERRLAAYDAPCVCKSKLAVFRMQRYDIRDTRTNLNENDPVIAAETRLKKRFGGPIAIVVSRRLLQLAHLLEAAGRRPRRFLPCAPAARRLLQYRAVCGRWRRS